MNPSREPFTSIRFGLDVYSLRSQQWTALELLEYAAERGLDLELIDTLYPFA